MDNSTFIEYAALYVGAIASIGLIAFGFAAFFVGA